MSDNPDGPAPDEILDFFFSVELLAAIGRLTLAVAQIDDMVTLLLFRLAGLTQQDGTIIVGRMSLSAKLLRISALMKGHPDKAIPSFAEACEAIEAFNRIRNAFAHGVFIGQLKATGELAMRAKIGEPVEGQHASQVIAFQEKYVFELVALLPTLFAELRKEWAMPNGQRGGPSTLRPRPQRDRQKSPQRNKTATRPPQRPSFRE